MDTRLVILVAASAFLALAIVYFIGSLLGAGRARRLAASAPHTVPLPMPDAAQIALTPLAPADARFPDPPPPLATTAMPVTLDEPEAFVAIQEPAWAVPEFAAPEPVAPEPVAVEAPEPVAPEPVAVEAPEPVAPEPVAVEAPEPVAPEPVAVEAPEPFVAIPEPAWAAPEPVAVAAPEVLEPPAPLPAWREVGTAASVLPDPVAPPEAPVPVWELEPPPAPASGASEAPHTATDVLADLRMLSVQSGPPEAPASVPEAAPAWGAAPERPAVVIHQPPAPSAPSDVRPPPPVSPSDAQPTPSPPTYAMVAPVELMFTDGPKRIGIRPGTATFLKYQRLAAVLLADLRKARAGGS